MVNRIAINAWAGRSTDCVAELDPAKAGWGLRGRFPPSAQKLAPVEIPGREKWWENAHGWGIILPETRDPGWKNKDKALARDAPLCIQELVKTRLKDELAPVFRYDPGDDEGYLRRYLPDGKVTYPKIGEVVGLTNINAMPLYLLIVADPCTIPWSLQYALNQRHLVGRIDLEEENALPNYVHALLSNWRECNADPKHGVVWSVDHPRNITREMRKTIAHPVYQKLQQDNEITVGNFAANTATVANLLCALRDNPALIVTTSHGNTAPLDNLQQMKQSIGFLVDQNSSLVKPAELLDHWSPGGAIWYAHACCSAGTNCLSSFDDLLTPGTIAHDIVSAVAKLRSQVAPLPKALLGAEKPLRAFVGHVEPTFDWTLRDGLNCQALANGIIQGLYNQLYQPWPIGLAFDDYHRGVGNLYSDWVKTIDKINDGDLSLKELALRTRLTACDRESLVILGDPTATLEPLPSKR